VTLLSVLGKLLPRTKAAEKGSRRRKTRQKYDDKI
jgi:hypothetical protein